jgi:hypothetical protein
MQVFIYGNLQYGSMVKYNFNSEISGRCNSRNVVRHATLAGLIKGKDKVLPRTDHEGSEGG